MLGKAEVLNQLPDYIGIGDWSDALVYAAQNLAVRAEKPGVLDWMKEKVG